MYKTLKVILIVLCSLFVSSGYGQETLEDSLLIILNKKIDDSLRIHILNELAWQLKSDQTEKALKYANEALALAKRTKNEPGRANALHNIGMINWYQGDYEQSSTFFYEALNIREALGDSIGLARSFNNIGHLYFRQKDYEKAIEFYNSSLKIREVLKDSIGLVYSLNSIGEVYSQQEDALALNYFQNAVNLAEKLGDQRGTAFAYSRLGEYYLSKQELQKALALFEKVLTITNPDENKFSSSQNLNNLAKVYFQQNKPEKAIIHALQSLKLANELEALELETDATALLAQAYASVGDFKNAYSFKTQNESYQMDIFNAESEKAINEIQIKYESEKQKSDLLNQVLQEEKKVNRLQTVLYISILVFSLILAALLGMRYKTLKNINKLLQEKQKEIEQSNESLRHSNAALEQFAYIASHDLKEPLRTIGNYTTLLIRRTNTSNDPEVKEFAQYIVGNVKQMYQLLEDLLAYSKITKGSQRPKEEVNLNVTVQSVINAIDHLVKKSNASIQVAPLPTVKAIPSQMAQLFQNIIVNSIKFNENEPIVDISYEKELNQHHIKIKDNGIGIEPEFHGKIFHIFKRLHKPKYQGTGIGLAICDKIIQQHKGRVWVESEIGQGSTFHFTLPV